MVQPLVLQLGKGLPLLPHQLVEQPPEQRLSVKRYQAASLVMKPVKQQPLAVQSGEPQVHLECWFE